MNYTVQRAWKALHFRMRVLKKGNSKKKKKSYRVRFLDMGLRAGIQTGKVR